MSLPASHQSLLDDLKQDFVEHNPKDALQHAANYILRRLETERGVHLSSQPGTQDSNKMADTAGPFSKGNPFGSNSIQEEDEERDQFGSPRDATFRDTGSTPFTNASPFGAAGGGAAGGSLFGAWGDASKDADTGADSTFSKQAAAGGRRTSVSAESMQPEADSGNWRPPSHPKSPDQYERLKAAVSNNFLFSQLDEESFATVMDALVEKSIPAANIKVISQGDEGDYFYIVESGEFKVYINKSGSLQPGPDGMGDAVATVGPGLSFGELALMYNAPRAATIVSTSKGGVLWALDRVTFRRILMDTAYSRRKMYEGFLEEVPLLSSLQSYERAKIADALATAKFAPGQHIIVEGEPGDAFYLLEAGEAAAFKSGTEHPVKSYHRGDFFGELALLDDKPRAASVVARTEVKVAKLGRDGFKRLLGPVEGIMRREDYGEHVDPLHQTRTAT